MQPEQLPPKSVSAIIKGLGLDGGQGDHQCVSLIDLDRLDRITKIQRPVYVPNQVLLYNLLWFDPDRESPGWGENDRDVSFTLAADKVTEFLKKHNLDLICTCPSPSTTAPAASTSSDGEQML
ncbi:Serine/threonine-protein phosphatase PP1 [Hordeum vulgare]|nr:Serine/threonine-protein phosphatase PP1 [Hordeum vulgare]